jgi:hypothetical protein
VTEVVAGATGSMALNTTNASGQSSLCDGGHDGGTTAGRRVEKIQASAYAWLDMLTFSLKIFKRHGCALWRNARALAETSSPANPVMNARAAIDAD